MSWKDLNVPVVWIWGDFDVVAVGIVEQVNKSSIRMRNKGNSDRLPRKQCHFKLHEKCPVLDAVEKGIKDLQLCKKHIPSLELALFR